VDGILAPAHDDGALAQAALDLLASPERREAMAQAARASAVERFGIDRVVPWYESLYQRVLSFGT
jgi:glycosyltransferase involved in cell wall biosynthesis